MTVMAAAMWKIGKALEGCIVYAPLLYLVTRDVDYLSAFLTSGVEVT
jgi:hypothetical protein